MHLESALIAMVSVNFLLNTCTIVVLLTLLSKAFWMPTDAVHAVTGHVWHLQCAQVLSCNALWLLQGDSCTEAFRCIEMQEGRPWSWDVDAFGLCSSVHCLLFGDYMQVEKTISSEGIALDCSYSFSMHDLEHQSKVMALQSSYTFCTLCQVLPKSVQLHYVSLNVSLATASHFMPAAATIAICCMQEPLDTD